jgi:hypothetical protein
MQWNVNIVGIIGVVHLKCGYSRVKERISIIAIKGHRFGPLVSTLYVHTVVKAPLDNSD